MYVSLSGLTDALAATKVQALTLCSTVKCSLSLIISALQQRVAYAIIKAFKCYIDGHINKSMYGVPQTMLTYAATK